MNITPTPGPPPEYLQGIHPVVLVHEGLVVGVAPEPEVALPGAAEEGDD
jgi:hypothetical protein